MNVNYALHRINVISCNDLGGGIGKKAAHYRRELKRCTAIVAKYNKGKPVAIAA